MYIRTSGTEIHYVYISENNVYTLQMIRGRNLNNRKNDVIYYIIDTKYTSNLLHFCLDISKTNIFDCKL